MGRMRAVLCRPRAAAHLPADEFPRTCGGVHAARDPLRGGRHDGESHRTRAAAQRQRDHDARHDRRHMPCRRQHKQDKGMPRLQFRETRVKVRT